MGALWLLEEPASPPALGGAGVPVPRARGAAAPPGGGSPFPTALTEALRVELPAHGADAGLPRLPLLQPQVQLLLQVHHVQAGAGRAGHLLHPAPVLLLPLPNAKSTGCYGAGPAGRCPARLGLAPAPAPLTAAAGWCSGSPAAA